MAAEAASADTADLLRKCFLFQATDEAGRKRLMERAHRRSYQSGEMIFPFGSPGQSMMTIMSGTVRISRPAPKGKEIILGEIGVGEVLGEIAILDGGERSAEATAVTRCELLVLERRDVIPFLEANPKVCLRLLELICGKLRRADERMTDIGFADLSVRLAKTILHYAEPDRHGGKPARLSLTQTQLADMIGGSRESVNRQLREWQKIGIVELKEGWLCIEDVASLSRVANRN
jgi:CRP/FNR family cyclic AMP-dependent transcriptional regulator